MFYWMFLSVSFKRWSKGWNKCSLVRFLHCSFTVTSPRLFDALEIIYCWFVSFLVGLFHLLLVCLTLASHERLAERLQENVADQSIGFSVLTIQVQTFRHHKRLLLSGRWRRKAFKWAIPTPSTASRLSPLPHAVCSLFVEHILKKKKSAKRHAFFAHS